MVNSKHSISESAEDISTMKKLAKYIENHTFLFVYTTKAAVICDGKERLKIYFHPFQGKTRNIKYYYCSIETNEALPALNKIFHPETSEGGFTNYIHKITVDRTAGCFADYLYGKRRVLNFEEIHQLLKDLSEAGWFESYLI